MVGDLGPYECVILSTFRIRDARPVLCMDAAHKHSECLGQYPECRRKQEMWNPKKAI
jgi:hypothetical protein